MNTEYSFIDLNYQSAHPCKLSIQTLLFFTQNIQISLQIFIKEWANLSQSHKQNLKFPL
jgi:hypothetical protein